MYSAGVSNGSSAAAGSTSNNQPSPYLSVLIAEGSASSFSLNSVSWPEIAAYNELSAFLLSIEPISCRSLSGAGAEMVQSRK